MIQASMTRGAALNILRRHNRGSAVGLHTYRMAILAIHRGYDRPVTRVPALTAAEREHANAVLCFNLGRALGRAA